MGEPQVHHLQGRREAVAVVAGAPRGQCAGPHLGEWDRSTFGLSAFAWGRLGNARVAGKQSSRLHRFGDVGAAVPPQCRRHSSVVFAFRPRQATLKFHEARYFLSARMVVPQVDSTTVRPNQTPDHVPVGAAGFFVAHAAPRRVFKSEFPFVVPHESLHHRFRIVATGRWINVNVMHRAIGTAVCGRCNQFAELLREIGGGEVARLHDLDMLPTLPRQEMTSESRAA
ncbi:hypothetical protein VB618_16840 [Microvirga sp. CF3062]|nr:hypothetical protein [Microvirga sp. CF3062]MEE1657869.1 hypothetical protein [Microvirga sp. CF3062]